MATGFVWHELYMWHNTGQAVGYLVPNASSFSKISELANLIPLNFGTMKHLKMREFLEPGMLHFENPATKRRFYNLLCASGFIDNFVNIKPRHATEEEIEYFHTKECIKKVKEVSNSPMGGMVGPLVMCSPGSYEIALLSTGGCLAALDQIMEGKIKNAYALVRPPGHHAEAESPMGFCIFNNVVITARYAQKKYGLKRIAIVDWDVHHGNGTQKAFYNESSVLFISVHQNKNYPLDMGMVEEIGEGDGKYFNINVPLPPGSGWGAYTEAFEEVVAPALNAFKPELILVSSGFDACFMDPQASMMLCSEDFRYFTQIVKTAAEQHCGGKLLVLHEGGYSEPMVPFCGLAVCEELLGKRTEIEDPFVLDVKALGDSELQPHQKRRIEQSAAVVAAMKQELTARQGK